MNQSLQLSFPRRPRAAKSPRNRPSPQEALLHHASLAYAVPAPVLLAVATLSIAALRGLFSPTTKPAFLTLTKTLRNNLQLILPRRVPPMVTPPKPLDQITRLDELRDRSIAEIAALQPTPEDYATLAPLQRRALLESAIERAYHTPRPVSRVMEMPVEDIIQESVVENVDTGVKRFWNAAEMLNGRAAALGFVLCLAREVAEPGHPSLFEQVVDVVVPIAQKTPPFLVAMVDRLVDLVT